MTSASTVTGDLTIGVDFVWDADPRTVATRTVAAFAAATGRMSTA